MPELEAGAAPYRERDVRYTTASGYKLRGTVGPQGELAMGLVAPGNARSAGATSLNLNTNGQIDSTGTAHVHQSGASCSYDFVWQKQSS